MKRRVTIRHIFTWNTFSSVCMLLLVEWITHTDADRATFVQPVARLATLEGVVWLPTVVVVLAVDKSVRRCRGRQLMMMLVSVVMVTRCYCATSQRTCTTEQKEAGLVSWEARLWSAQVWITQFFTLQVQITPHLPLPRKAFTRRRYHRSDSDNCCLIAAYIYRPTPRGWNAELA